MRLYARRLDFRHPGTIIIGGLLLFYLSWVITVALTAPRVPRYAYATYLSEPYVKGDDNTTTTEDGYYLGARVMVHRLLYSEAAGKYPVIVLVTEGVSEDKRQRLRKDGATVIAVPTIEAEEWMKPNEPRWHHMLTKLKLFDLEEYDKICYMDADILIRWPIDLVFETDAASEYPTLNREPLSVDDPPLPGLYTIAGNPDSYGYDHPYPFPDYLNAGFMVFKPSSMLYRYYLHISKQEGTINTGMMEQDLLNHAHRRDGNMPWRLLQGKWNIDHPRDEDWQEGYFTYHDKYWEWSHERHPRFLALWNQHYGEMLSYWRVLEHGAAKARRPNRWYG